MQEVRPTSIFAISAFTFDLFFAKETFCRYVRDGIPFSNFVNDKKYGNGFFILTT